MLIFNIDWDPKNGVLFVVQLKSINEIENRLTLRTILPN